MILAEDELTIEQMLNPKRCSLHQTNAIHPDTLAKQRIGPDMTVKSATNAEFRNWFKGKTALARKLVNRVVLVALGQECDELDLADFNNRWYLVNELNRTKAFQDSGVVLFRGQKEEEELDTSILEIAKIYPG